MKEKNSFVACGWGREVKRKFKVIIGETYIVDQLNPRAKKYRGEKVKLVKHDDFGGGTEVLRIESEWHVKRNCLTEMDICDLRPEDKNLELPVD